jgi:hypothetical protein
MPPKTSQRPTDCRSVDISPVPSVRHLLAGEILLGRPKDAALFRILAPVSVTVPIVCSSNLHGPFVSFFGRTFLAKVQSGKALRGVLALGPKYYVG